MKTVEEVMKILGKYSPSDICYTEDEKMFVIDGEEFNTDLSELRLAEISMPYEVLSAAYLAPMLGDYR